MSEQKTETKADLRTEWDRLSQLQGLSPGKRGFELESLVLRLARAEGLECGPSYRLKGEQVDGLLELDGRYLLLEAKWVAAPLPASEVYAFRAKVDGKLVGTVGVFVAVNGFNEAVPDVLRYGKEINVVLVDGGDLLLSLQDRYSFRSLLRMKLRRAAQYGEVLYTYRRYLDEHVA